MIPKSATLNVKALQFLLTQIGSATTGRKDVLLSRLEQNLKSSRFPSAFKARESTRILSIDMGIKNLAFCVADVKAKIPGSKAAEAQNVFGMDMSIIEWRRLDVAEEVARSQYRAVSETGAGFAGENVEAADPYTPAALSHTAYKLLKNTLLPYNPDLLLIERQRWRSGGGSAVQQWTVRVNTLEGMLWAILTALREETPSQSSKTKDGNTIRGEYGIFGVDPKRVGNFWVGKDVRSNIPEKSKETEHELLLGPDGEVEDFLGDPKKAAKTPGLSRGKAEKKARIELVRSWLTSNTSMSTTLGVQNPSASLECRPLISFSFSQDADLTRQLLCATSYAKERKKRSVDDVSKSKKLDDITDCFLQAAAWVAWEENRIMIAQSWDSKEGPLPTPSKTKEKEGVKSKHAMARAIGKVKGVEKATEKGSRTNSTK
ncbi:ribonuclease H-like protein [Lindgomyces ingoldianus]|uniref:Ribonuclease H-like protein n=1 Tax=Lindgomyces ingoldianus TaxID=673940 RepID=A0ACB6QJ72_9PLEO|nr:ribonuclease H-like protein [Lindgomyces ingoldianus]KAF2467004.1 ribonuclease H-like protein [Lindgomyces ingoldianus]